MVQFYTLQIFSIKNKQQQKNKTNTNPHKQKKKQKKEEKKRDKYDALSMVFFHSHMNLD